MPLMQRGFPPIFRVGLVRNPHSLFAISRILGGVYRPVSIKSHIWRTKGKRSGSFVRVFSPVSLLVSFKYPTGAKLGYQPFSILVLRPRLTFLLKSSTYFCAMP